MSDETDDLGIYFKCYSGANAHFALSEPNSFALQDALGRDWICFPIPPHVVRELDMLTDLVDVAKADEKAGEKTLVRLVFCREVGDLAGELVGGSSEDEEDERGR